MKHHRNSEIIKLLIKVEFAEINHRAVKQLRNVTIRFQGTRLIRHT